MEWFTAAAIAAAVLAVAAFIVWRRWIAPWSAVERLADAVAAEQMPPTFLTTGNASAERIGFALERIAQRERETTERLTERLFSSDAVFAAMPDGLVLLDERRDIRLANAAFSRIYRGRQTAPGTSLIEATGDAMIDQAVQAAIESEEPRDAAVQMGRQGMDRRHFEVTAIPVRGGGTGAARETRGAVLLFHDVTQVRQTEDIRRDFVANVSHELRTPLSIFRGYLETLLEDPEQPRPELLRILEVMDRQSQRLHSIVEDLLSLARMESPELALHFAEVDLAEFLATTSRDWQPRFAGKQLEMVVELAGDLPLVAADEDRLQEVVYNLLDNALKYSRPGGSVNISAAQHGDWVHIIFADSGIGIRSEDLPRVFERFYRADKARSRAQGGTGLGLAIVKHIVLAHGGRVEAESEFGRGTTIRVILPLQPSRGSATAGRGQG